MKLDDRYIQWVKIVLPEARHFPEYMKDSLHQGYFELVRFDSLDSGGLDHIEDFLFLQLVYLQTAGVCTVVFSLFYVFGHRKSYFTKGS